MINKRNIGVLLALTVTSLTALSFHSYLGSMSRFIADDYCESYIAQHFGLIRSIWYWYLAWDGAFTDSIIDWLLVLIGPGGIPFVTTSVLIAWVTVSALTIHLFLPQGSSPLIKAFTSIAFGTLVVFITLLITPNVPQSLYWWTGMRAYTLPFVLFTFYLCLYQIIVIKLKKGNLVIWSLLSFFIIFLTGGLSELFTPILTVFFTGWVSYDLIFNKTARDKRSFSFILWGLIGAITSLVIMVIAPGNSVRQALYTPPPGILEILNISISALLAFISGVLITPEKITGILGAFLCSLWFGSTIERANKTQPWIPVVTLLAGIAFIFGYFVPAAWALSGTPPDRALSIPSFILVASFLITGYMTGCILVNIQPQLLVNIRRTAVVIGIACIGFTTWVNVNNLYNSRQPFIEFSHKWDVINEQIILARSAGKPKVHIPAMDSWTNLDKPQNNPQFWQNVCYSKYYGVPILSP